MINLINNHKLGFLIKSRGVCFCLLMVLNHSFANSQILKGQILDTDFNEPIPGVNVFIEDGSIGTSSDENGFFEMEGNYTDQDILSFSSIGFEKYQILISSISNKNEIQVLLHENQQLLNEVVVRPDDSYEHWLMSQIIEHKNQNNPLNKTIDYQLQYQRKSVFLNNVSNGLTQAKMFANEQDAFLSLSDSTKAIPILISELKEEIINGEKGEERIILEQSSECLMPELQRSINTVLNEKVAGNINFYNNQTVLLSHGLPSPISSHYRMYYNIYIVDSVDNERVKKYKVDFTPKNKEGIAFEGYFWVDSSSFALTNIYAKLASSKSFNFVDAFETEVDYQELPKIGWYFKSQKTKAILGLASSEDSTKSPINILFQNRIQYQYIQNAAIADSSVNIEMKIIPYDSLESHAYKGIGILKNNVWVKNIGRFSDMSLNGYYNINKIDIGSYMDIYRNNAIEGNRFTLPFRTSERWSKTFSMGGYLGYGLRDREFKYGAKFNYLLPFESRTTLMLKYDFDYYALTRDKFVEFIRENPFEGGGGNIASAITSQAPNPYMIKQQKLSLTIERQLNNNIGILLRPFYERYYSNKHIPFESQGVQVNGFNNYGLLADMRFSFGQSFDDGFFYRIYYGNQKPVIHLSAIIGQALFLREKQLVLQPYLHLNASIKNRLNFGRISIRSMLNIGYINGEIPYPLLHNPRGTRDLGFARYHYNLLYNSSFVADLYANLHISINGKGVLLSKVPLIKKLQLRESVSFKAFWGKLLGNHTNGIQIPDNLRAPNNEPYMEMGFGITNVFKVLRVEYVTRLNKSESFNQVSAKHGIRFRIEVSF